MIARNLAKMLCGVRPKKMFLEKVVVDGIVIVVVVVVINVLLLTYPKIKTIRTIIKPNRIHIFFIIKPFLIKLKTFGEFF